MKVVYLTSYPLNSFHKDQEQICPIIGQKCASYPHLPISYKFLIGLTFIIRTDLPQSLNMARDKASILLPFYKTSLDKPVKTSPKVSQLYQNTARHQ